MKFLRSIAMLLASGTLSGCATIIESSNDQGDVQRIAISTFPEVGANCEVRNTRAYYYVTTPGVVTVHRSRSDLGIVCTKAGYAQGQAVAVSKINPKVYWNIFNAGYGVLYDASTGASWKYPEAVTVAMQKPVQ